MRDIKFRGWDRINNRWFYWKIEEPFTYKWSGYLKENNIVLDWSKSGEFTGFHDKDNVEIYEGDRLKGFDEHSYIVSAMKDKEYITFTVKFIDGAFWACDDYVGDSTTLLRNITKEHLDEVYSEQDFIPKGCEVIGNIHKIKS